MEVALYVIPKKTSEIKPLCLFSGLFYVKHKAFVHLLGSSKKYNKEIIKGHSSWYTIQKRKGCTKINAS